MRARGERVQLLRSHALIAALELQVGDQCRQIGVAATLAVAVLRALNVGGAGLDPRQRVCDAAARVVMAVDPDPDAGRAKLAHHRLHRLRDAVRQRTAVGVTAGDGLGARLRGGAQAGERVLAVVDEAVEEVLGVVDDPLACGDEERDRLGDHPQVLGAVDLDHLLQVQAPGLADERAYRREAVGQDLQRGIVLRPHVPPARHAECRDLRVLETLAGQQLEELELLGVGAREARLDQVDPELVEHVRDAHLLVRRQRHALPLHAITQGGVVELDLGHVNVPARALRRDRATPRSAARGHGWLPRTRAAARRSPVRGCRSPTG